VSKGHSHLPKAGTSCNMSYCVKCCHNQKGFEELVVNLGDRVKLGNPQEAHEQTTDSCRWKKNAHIGHF